MSSVPPAVRKPGFDPASLGTGILHLGCGAFHRGHQAVATQRAIEAEGPAGTRWGIASASMLRSTTPNQLRPQDGLYTLLERSEQGIRAEVVGSLREVLHAPSDERGLPARLADADTHLVTLTVTADGYLLEPATGRLQASHPDILHDLGHRQHPRSAVGAITYGLDVSRRAGRKPPVILSCDNVASNGNTLRQAVIDFASLHDDALAGWIERTVRFPNSMVDRIVPATTDLDREDAARLLGLEDAAPVSAEPYLQWIIENFDGPRPLWEAAGARFVTDVQPFELAKLRLLNGAHMMLAYVGALAGFRTIADTIADPLFRTFVETFMLREQGQTLDMEPAALQHYVSELITRLQNPAIQHDVGRIGRNGSGKLATRLMEPLREGLHAGRDSPCAILGIAAWIRWFALRDTTGTHVAPIDPSAAEMKNLCETIGEDHHRQAASFLGIEPVFGPALPDHDRIVLQLAQALRDLHLYPVRDVVQRALALAA
ncbi:MAG: mannitol dehydrogenase family protein [Janthinobacterium lividum]